MDTRTILLIIILGGCMFFMVRFQHLQTINQILKTENQTLKTVVPMLNTPTTPPQSQSQQNIRKRQVIQGTAALLDTQNQSITAPLAHQQTPVQQNADVSIPTLDIGAPLTGYNVVDASIEPGAPLPQTGMSPMVPMGMGPTDPPLVSVSSSSAPAASQYRRGGLNPFPPIQESVEMPGQSRQSRQYGLGTQFQESITGLAGRTTTPPMEYGSAADRAYI